MGSLLREGERGKRRPASEDRSGEREERETEGCRERKIKRKKREQQVEFYLLKGQGIACQAHMARCRGDSLYQILKGQGQVHLEANSWSLACGAVDGTFRLGPPGET